MAKKIDYNKEEASWKFVALKVIEIAIVLIIIFGFYSIGLYINSIPTQSCMFRIGLHIPCPHTDNPTAFNLWTIGLLFCLLIIFTLIMWAIIIAIIAGIIYLIIIWNWAWAKRWAETDESKKRRANEHEKKLRNTWTLLEDDLVTIKRNLKVGERYDDIKFTKSMKQYKGKTGRILDLDVDDHTYKISTDNQTKYWTVPMLKLTEKRENPKLKKWKWK
jgi:uncharacterized membrane protein